MNTPINIIVWNNVAIRADKILAVAALTNTIKVNLTENLTYEFEIKEGKTLEEALKIFINDWVKALTYVNPTALP